MLDMKFTNGSLKNFDRSVRGANTTVLDSRVTTPSTSLDSGASTNDTWDNEVAKVYGALTYWCCWSYPETQLRFGIKIIDGGQPGGIGPRPYWEVMWDLNATEPEPVWIPNGADPSVPYKWPRETGFLINAVAASSHTGLTVNVDIQDIPKGRG